MVKDRVTNQPTLGDFIICSATSDEAFNLEKECNITESATIHIITDEISQPSLFQKLEGESETTVEELNASGEISRILIGSDNDKIIDAALSKGWDSTIWSGIVIPEVGSLLEYRKVYPVYTS